MIKTKSTLDYAWEAREKFYEMGDRHQEAFHASMNAAPRSGGKWSAFAYQRYQEGLLKWALAKCAYAQGDTVWADAVQAAFPETTLQWIGGKCILGNGEVFEGRELTA